MYKRQTLYLIAFYAYADQVRDAVNGAQVLGAEQVAPFSQGNGFAVYNQGIGQAVTCSRLAGLISVEINGSTADL